MKQYVSWFSFRAPKYLVYMLQQVEYRPEPFFGWVLRCMKNNSPLSAVMRRQELRLTRKARLLLALAYILTVVWYTAVIVIVALLHDRVIGVLFGAALLALLPAALASMLMLVVAVADALIVKPAERRMIAETKSILEKHPGTTIVVAGSYGKTTMKELLASILGDGLDVAATAGNRNTPAAHAQFARALTGKEDVVIFELGEGDPGDVRRFAATLHPDVAIITGLAPNHLDKYGTVEELARDFMALRDFVPVEKLYYAADSTLLGAYIAPGDQTYGLDGGKTWKVSDVHITAERTEFSLTYKEKTLALRSKLLGRHQVAPLALVAVIAFDMGLTVEKIEAANEAIKPYEHRMSSYSLSGATIVDDTYNGNLEGIIAGLSFLSEIEAKRKLYVTPGLVDQGDETDNVHRKIAGKIAEVAPDVLVLMRNSATDIIQDELKKLQYQGDIQIQDDPLAFYQGLEHIVRGGDVVLMQNDWTDNYH